MPEIDYECLSSDTKVRIAAYALKKGLSIEEALEEIAIEFLAMGGPAMIGRPKAKLYQLAPKEGLKNEK